MQGFQGYIVNFWVICTYQAIKEKECELWRGYKRWIFESFSTTKRHYSIDSKGISLVASYIVSSLDTLDRENSSELFDSREKGKKRGYECLVDN